MVIGVVVARFVAVAAAVVVVEVYSSNLVHIWKDCLVMKRDYLHVQLISPTAGRSVVA